MQPPIHLKLPDAETPKPSPPSGRIESLDSLRGLAALAVLLGHSVSAFAWPMSLKWTTLPMVNILFDGRSAVTMFFVLSGFVLARPYLASAGQSPRHLLLPTFYIRRFTRIWIPWFCVFCLSALAQIFIFRPHTTIPPMSEWLGTFWHSPLSLSSALRQCAFALHAGTQQLLPQDWSLGVELKGSALIPVFLFLLRKHILFLLAAALLLLFCLPTGIYYVSFVIGVLTARWHKGTESPLGSLGFTSKLGILLTGLLLYQSRLLATQFGEMTGATEKTVWCVASLGCALILGATLNSRRIQAALTHSAMVFLGRISYSVYLTQFIILLCLLPPVIHVLNALRIHQSSVLLILTLCFSVFMTVALSTISFRLFEAPSIQCGHWVTKLWQRRFGREGS